MLAPLAVGAGALQQGGLLLFEVACAAGVPDLVLLELDGKQLALRDGAGPVTDPVGVRVMVASSRLGQPNGGDQDTEVAGAAPPVTADDLAAPAGVTARYLRQVVLPRMQEAGHLVSEGSGRWASAYAYGSLARSLVTVEAKLRNWRGGLGQAARHAGTADAAWLALDAEAVRPALAHSDWFEAYGVGLMSVSTSGVVDRLIEVRRSRARQPERELLAERAVELHLSGRVSGPVPVVFGRELSTSTGADPRLTGAGAG